MRKDTPRKLLERVQRAYWNDGRTGSMREVNRNVPDMKARTYETLNEYLARHVSGARPLRELSPWCTRCTNKYHRQTRSAECECE